MRFRLGRPSLARHAALFGVPAAVDGDPSVTFLGVASLLVSDGHSAVMTDGFFSRPSLAVTALRRLRPDPARIGAALARAGVDRLDAVIPVHTHYDHALDSAAVATRTGAVIVGGASSAALARSQGMPEERIVVATPGDTLTFGTFEIAMVLGAHCPPDRYPGQVVPPLRFPARVSAYRCGEAWSLVIRHSPSDRSVLVVGSAGFVPGALAGQRAEVAYLGVGQLGIQAEDYLVRYWQETVRTVGARRVVLIHWDDFFRPLDEPLRPLPRLVDDLDRSVRILSALAAEDGVSLQLPTLWQRADPWA